MTTRDRALLLAVLGIALLGGFWFLALAPKRSDAKALDGKLAAAQQRLQTAQSAAATAADAKQKYNRDYADVARLGEAVPSDDNTATLLFQLQAAARSAKVDMRTFEVSAGAASASATSTPAAPTSTSASTSSVATQSAAATLPPGATVGTAGFPTMPFTFSFKGSFADLQHLLDTVQGFVRVKGDDVAVKGRLLTIDGISLTPQTFPQVKANIQATAFLLPETSTATSSSTGTAPSDQSASSSTTSTTSSATVAP